MTTIITFMVILLGAYARLTDSGLGCPDWPGCYGQLLVPREKVEIDRANQAFPERPFEEAKAWPEMIHRYAASTLGFLILVIAAISWVNRRHPAQPAKLAGFVLALVIFQGLLGMWTVTLKLYPPVVLAHLLGGFTLFSLLTLMSLRLSQALQPVQDHPVQACKPYVLGGLALLIAQIALGGWTAANYAALNCTQLPVCQGNWTAYLNFSEAFKLWHANDRDFEFAPHLSESAQMTIHVSHRMGAMIVGLYLAALGFFIQFKATTLRHRRFATGLLGLLLIQIVLGITNVKMGLPLMVAVAHNGVGALLMATVVVLYYSIRKKA